MADGILDSLLGEVVLDRFLIDEVIGEGSSCLVFHARTRSGREVVVKVLREVTRQSLARHRREVSVLRMLPPSPHVVAYVADGALPRGVPILVTEYVDGATLKVAMERSPAQSERHAAAVVAQICAALSELHHLGVVHRDVKPSNVLLSRGGTIKLIDFGLVLDAQGILGLLEAGEDHSREPVFDPELDRGVLAGTLAYMAPEQFSDALVGDPAQTRTDTGADVYSLGVILYELLSGRLPVGLGPPPTSEDGHTSYQEIILRRLRIGDDSIEPLSGVSPALASIVTKALSFDPDRRHPDARALGAELLEFIALGAGALPLFVDPTNEVVLPGAPSGEETQTWPRHWTSELSGRAEPTAEVDELTRPFFHGPSAS